MNNGTFFFGIGVSRSGTTWLGKCLASHPEICFSNPKETHFFDDDNIFKDERDVFLDKFFTHCSNETVKGEFTPGYMNSPRTAKRIKKLFPEAKLIVILRNPIDRAISEFKYNTGRELENEISFEAALNGPLRNRYINRGYYATNLQPFLENFGHHKIFFALYDDIDENPKLLLKQIYDFLGVNSNFTPTESGQYINMSSVNKRLTYVPFVSYLIRLLQQRKDFVVLVYLNKLTKPLGINRLIRTLHKMNHRRLNATKKEKGEFKISEATRQKLLKLYHEEILKTQMIVGRDLSHWLK